MNKQVVRRLRVEILKKLMQKGEVIFTFTIWKGSILYGTKLDSQDAKKYRGRSDSSVRQHVKQIQKVKIKEFCSFLMTVDSQIDLRKKYLHKKYNHITKISSQKWYVNGSQMIIGSFESASKFLKLEDQRRVQEVEVSDFSFLLSLLKRKIHNSDKCLICQRTEGITKC
ncbi:hypothetical protein EGR_11143 [Echinococcus granulosus]|uniref:Uncharacterized protein n=1 Tax=Echinococcus granulosus TaxID=6210 RepID=W6TYZ5_ECHGR|nr:hypothetical protein EGR_11143 [Echinococcus granulosus]EUB54000.1 hypothetical protein EGR_11143 [Echinococcus granulosus]